MRSLNQSDIVRQRLFGSHLTGPPLASPVDVVRTLGAVQAQDYAGAKWAIGMRTQNATEADVERAVASGEILRTHVLRPTWHFVLPNDIRWMLSLTGARIGAAMASYNRKIGLTPAVFKKSRGVIERALRDGQHLTRAELRARLEKAKVALINGQVLAHLMMQAELDRVICNGPNRGKQFTYALLDERAAACPELDRDEALSRLAGLYFRGRGPATVHDFAWWSGLVISDARRAIEIIGSQLTPIEIDGRAMWMIEREAPAPAVSRVAHLLPNYDEYFIGHRDRSAIGARAGTRLVTGGNALINHILTIGGEIVGGWKRATSPNGTVVDLALIVPLSAPEKKQLEVARARLEWFLGHPVAISERAKPVRRRRAASRDAG